MIEQGVKQKGRFYVDGGVFVSWTRIDLCAVRGDGSSYLTIPSAEHLTFVSFAAAIFDGNLSIKRFNYRDEEDQEFSASRSQTGDAAREVFARNVAQRVKILQTRRKLRF
jgi:hypothetical protein